MKRLRTTTSRLALVAVLPIIAPQIARADCVPDGTLQNGATVNCTATDADGFDGSAYGGLTVNTIRQTTPSTVNVEIDGMKLGDDNTLNADHYTKFHATDAGETALELGNGNTYVNTSSSGQQVDIIADDGDAVAMGDSNDVMFGYYLDVTASGNGIVMGDGNSVETWSYYNKMNVGGTGIVAGDDNTIYAGFNDGFTAQKIAEIGNNNTFEVYLSNNVNVTEGITAGDDNKITLGNYFTVGDGPIVDAGKGNEIVLDGQMFTAANGGGIVAGDDTTVTLRRGYLQTTGLGFDLGDNATVDASKGYLDINAGLGGIRAGDNFTYVTFGTDGDGNEFDNSGSIDTDGIGMELGNGATAALGEAYRLYAGEEGILAGDDLALANKGLIQAAGNAISAGQNATVDNTGRIVSFGAAVSAGAGLDFTNSGYISSADGVVGGAGSTLVNMLDGQIFTYDEGVGMRAGDNSTVVNHGEIESGSTSLSVGKDGTVTNSGSLSGTTGMGGGDRSVITNEEGGDVYGSDTGISAGKFGIVYNYGEVVGETGSGIKGNDDSTIYNYGEVWALGNDAIKTDKKRVTVYNYGYINAADEGAEGRDDYKFYNYGTIEAYNDAIQATNNIYIYNGVDGVIHSYGQDENKSDDADGDAVDMTWGTVDNYGKITAVATDEGGIDFDASIQASTINNYATGYIEGSYGVEVDSADNGLQTVNNWGEIVGFAGAGVSLGKGNDSVVNYGIIRGKEDPNGATIGIDLGAGDDMLTLYAGQTIEGDVLGGDGSDKLVLTALADGEQEDALDGTLTGFEKLSAESGIWTLGGLYSFSDVSVADMATLIALQGFGGNAVVDGRLEVGGTISGLTVDSGGTVAVGGDEIGSLSVDGTTTISGTMEVDVDADGNSDTLASAGGITIDGISAKLLVHAATGDYADATDYTIMTAASGGVTGEFSSVEDDLAFLDASVVYSPSDVVLTMTRNDIGFEDITDTSNQRSVAGAIERSGGSDLANEILQMTEEEARHAYDELSGEGHASNMNWQFSQTQLINGMIQNRLAFLLSRKENEIAPLGYVSTGPKPEAFDQVLADSGPSYGGWASGYGEWLSVDSDGNAHSMDATMGGLMAGLDLVSGNSAFGVGAGYGKSDSDIEIGDTDIETDTFFLAAYAAHRFDRVKLAGGGSYAWSSHDSERMALGDTLTASYDGTTAGVFAELAYEAMMGRVGLEPFVGLAYVNVDQDGFTEKGGLGALVSEGQSFDSVTSTLGIRFAYDVTTAGGTRFTPRASIAWRHAYGDVTPDAVMTFATAGTSFTVEGLPIAENSVVAGAGLGIDLTEGMGLGFDYVGHFSEEANSNALKAAFHLAF